MNIGGMPTLPPPSTPPSATPCPHSESRHAAAPRPHQMLLGVCEPLCDRLRPEGFAVRIYVPLGADWYGYSTRRLKENRASLDTSRGFDCMGWGCLPPPPLRRPANASDLTLNSAGPATASASPAHQINSVVSRAQLFPSLMEW